MTVIIPAHNEAECIQDTVRSCLQQSYPPESVIVVADSCTDDTAQLARDAGATVLIASCGGKAKAQNFALPHVTTDVIVGVDADTDLDPDCIELMLADIAQGWDGTCAAVMPKQTKGLFVRSRRFEYALARKWWKRIQKEVRFVYVLSGCACAFRTEAIRAIGGFSHAIISEDTETTWQLYAAGYKLTYTREALCWTSEPETWMVYKKQAQRWASGSFQIIGRNAKLLRNPRAALVVLANLIDLVLLPATVLGWVTLGLVNPRLLAPVALWMLGHSLIMIGIAARELGLKEALLCFWPHKIVSVPNRMIYLWSLVREWVLGRHYASWTGRQGRKTVITPMSAKRKLTFSGASGVAVWLIPATLATAPVVADVANVIEPEQLPALAVLEEVAQTVLPHPDASAAATPRLAYRPAGREPASLSSAPLAAVPEPSPSFEPPLAISPASPVTTVPSPVIWPAPPAPPFWPAPPAPMPPVNFTSFPEPQPGLVDEPKPPEELDEEPREDEDLDPVEQSENDEPVYANWVVPIGVVGRLSGRG